MGQSDGRFALDPRRRHHPLPYFIRVRAPLRRLVLHTPLADLLKCERRQLPPASNTVRHVLLRKIISSGRTYVETPPKHASPDGRMRPSTREDFLREPS